MKLLFIEDEPEYHEALREELTSLDLEIEIAENAEQALAALAAGGYDLFVCDLRIPASDQAPEPRTEHGVSVFHRIRADAPGVPAITFSAFGDLDDLGDALSEAGTPDLYGNGAEKLVVSRKKTQLPAVGELVAHHVEGLNSLEDVEISGAEARGEMSELDARLLRIHARRYEGVALRAQVLAGGRSGALTLKVEAQKDDGSPASRVVAKLNESDEVDDEEARYGQYVSPLLDAGTYSNRLETLRAGARDRACIFYSLAEAYDSSLFAVLAANDARAARVVAEVKAALAPWHSSINTRILQVRDVRRLFVRDQQLGALLRSHDWVTDEVEGGDVRVREAPAHGDLHGGNTLVRPDDRAMLIDFGRVGLAVNAVDPVTLELSAVLHPDSPVALGNWPSEEQAEHWNDRATYLEGCPIPDFVTKCRDWTDGVSGGDRETDAVVYGYALRQLRFPEVNLDLAAAYSRGAANRLGQ